MLEVSDAARNNTSRRTIGSRLRSARIPHRDRPIAAGGCQQFSRSAHLSSSLWLHFFAGRRWLKSRRFAQIAARKTNPVFAHLGSPERAKPYFDYYKLSDVERVSNPDASLYQHPVFGLSRRNPFLHLLSPAVWKGWLKGALLKYGIGGIQEDAHQMPGVFFLKERRIVRGFRYQSIADEPDYLKLIGAG